MMKRKWRGRIQKGFLSTREGQKIAKRYERKKVSNANSNLFDESLVASCDSRREEVLKEEAKSISPPREECEKKLKKEKRR